ncbi:hypothetical protein SCATT_29860 [Streptantibioticus cattleyicolor NRRL 8057 = DSM 46488]|uniref:Rv2525c-like glycoside hydrolase-like domain-containing protein n=2 Tax=Kitasatosporales TaxID=85011 RepID=G8WSB8_STREN|nr:hypothetical protein SCATT_29860 [Streptantibioticus cattleyicolor NRRL 8057 = DSM 46488]
MKPGRPQHGRPRQQEEGDQPGAASASAPTTGDMRRLGAQIFRGWAFDSCSAPDLGTMRAWRQSPYGAVGAYIGGRARSCAQPNLSAGWARSVVAMGWRILPVYVGSQSPCALERRERNYPIDTAHASANGAAEAADAARAAGALGLAKHSPVYLDIEAYDVRSDRCTEPVIAFTQAWNRALRARGYVPGFYSSADSGVAQLEVARRLGRPSLPDLMWFARWNVPPDVYGEAKLSRTAWSPHRRVHQFAGDIHESHGGKSLKIDRNLVDAPVAIMAGAKKNAGDPESADEDGPGTAWTEGKAPARSAARLPNRLGHPGRRSARAPLRFGPYAHAHPRPSAYARAYAPARVRLPERAGVPFVPVAVPGTTLVRNPVAGAVPGVPFPYPSVPSPFPAGLGVPSAGSWRSWPGAGAALRLP